MTTPTENGFGPTPIAALRGMTAYAVPRASTPIVWRLDGNEGAVPPSRVVTQTLAHLDPASLRLYPSTAMLEAAIADKLGVNPATVIVTAGGDDGLFRAIRAVVAPGREMILPVPTFEMLDRFARLAGGTVIEVPWPANAPYPTDAVVAAIAPQTAAICVVTPNNPTGAVATAADLRRLSAAAPHALLIVDLAYVEFADVDVTMAALELPNALVFRTLSKAWGLAGLRVGYAVGPETCIGWLRAVGLPYPISAPSIAVALERIENGDADMTAFVSRVKVERAELSALLRDLGAEMVVSSQGNFVFAHVPDAVWLRDAMAGLGIAIRAFPNKPGLTCAVRITCPGDADLFSRLERALRTALRPTRVIVDLDDAGEMAAEEWSEWPIPVKIGRPCESDGAWLVGDSETAVLRARQLGLVPIGVLPVGMAPESPHAAEFSANLIAAGAARVVANVSAVKEWLVR